jgi:hypothetical protein
VAGVVRWVLEERGEEGKGAGERDEEEGWITREA